MTPNSKLQVFVQQVGYRDCVILRASTYQGRGEAFFDYQFDPAPVREHDYDPLPSQGGAAPLSYFRERA